MLGKSLGRRQPDFFFGIGEGIDQERQHSRIADSRQGKDTSGAESRRSVYFSAPDRLHLHVPGRLQKNVRLVVVQLVERLDRSKFGAAELVAFFRVCQKAFE